MQESEDLLQSTGLEVNDLVGMMHPLSAADSLAKHVLFEMYIEKIHPGADGIAMGRDLAKHAMSGDTIPAEFDVDPAPLYDYCDAFFTGTPFKTLLCRAYGLRLLLLQRTLGLGGIFLSNPKVLDLLSRLPVEQESTGSTTVSDDVVAWELFRQLVSPVIDPLDEKRIELIVKYRAERAEEVTRLKSKCLSLVNAMRSLPSTSDLEHRVARLIASEVHDELSDLLRMDANAFKEFLVSLFSDDKSWMAFSALAASIFTGQSILTAASAVAALSTVGSMAFKSAAQRRETLKTSAYSLVYNLKRT